MALQSIGGLAFVPAFPANTASAPNLITHTVDADGEGIAAVFQAPEAGSIVGMGAQTLAVTTGDAGMLWQLESVDATATPAIPSGTDIGGGTPTSVALNPSAANTWYECTFTNPYTVTKGQLIAAVIKRPASGSFNGQFRAFDDERSTAGAPSNYLSVNVGAGWVANQGSSPCMAIRYASNVYHMIPGLFPIGGSSTTPITTTAFNSASATNRIGVQWVPRFKARVWGVWVWTAATTTNGWTVVFYDTDGTTVLATATAGANFRSVATAGPFYLPFDTPVTPAVGSTYRIAVVPGATNITIYDFLVDAGTGGSKMAMFPLSTDFVYRAYTSGAWDVAISTRRPFMGLIIDQLDDGAGAGGGGNSWYGIMSGE